MQIGELSQNDWLDDVKSLKLVVCPKYCLRNRQEFLSAIWQEKCNIWRKNTIFRARMQYKKKK